VVHPLAVPNYQKKSACHLNLMENTRWAKVSLGQKIKRIAIKDVEQFSK
jgi:hypothetical protein